jgi:hypothetical protein
MRASLLTLVLIACGGCTHRQLSRSIIHQASTIVTVEYQMVLDNLAMYTASPELLPWHVRISDGTVQVNDEGGLSELGVQWGSTPGFTQALRAVRSVTEQWGAHPVTDPLVVKTLQDAYRQAVGLPPLPDPGLLAQSSTSVPTAGSAAGPATGDETAAIASDETREELPPAGAAASEKVAAGAVGSELPYDGAPLALLRDKIDVPVGWFRVGRKCDVPKEACFVGHYCDHYVWVMPEHVEDLSHFTLIVLGITKHGISDQPTRGLVFVRR